MYFTKLNSFYKPKTSLLDEKYFCVFNILAQSYNVSFSLFSRDFYLFGKVGQPVIVV